MKLSGNTILITGGTSGIGFEMARQLLERGNKVIITGRTQARLDETKRKLPQVHTLAGDVSDTKDISALFQKVTSDFPEVNILLNNAGIMKTVNLHKPASSLDELTSEIVTNLMAPIRLSNLFISHLSRKPAAAIVNVSSGLAFTPLPESPIYCATKAALHSFSLSLRVQLLKTSIKVFEVAPPATKTELLGDFNPDDMKGISIMSVQDMVSESLKGIERDQFEIRPGQSNQLKFMSRIAPDFILKQMSRNVDRLLAT